MCIIPNKSLFLLTEGCYSDYSFKSLFKAKQDLDLDDLEQQFKARYRDQRDSFELSNFAKWLAEEGFAKQIGIGELHCGTYSTMKLSYTPVMTI